MPKLVEEKLKRGNCREQKKVERLLKICLKLIILWQNIRNVENVRRQKLSWIVEENGDYIGILSRNTRYAYFFGFNSI